MVWDVVLDDEFAAWLDEQEADVRNAILAHAALLRERSPLLDRPYVDALEATAFPDMKELRVQFRGDPWRILFAFDSKRAAVLLVGGNKRGDRRWYKTQIPIADERFERHLKRLKDKE
jgi:hypothetical protein